MRQIWRGSSERSDERSGAGTAIEPDSQSPAAGSLCRRQGHHVAAKKLARALDMPRTRRSLASKAPKHTDSMPRAILTKPLTPISFVLFLFLLCCSFLHQTLRRFLLGIFLGVHSLTHR